jgi:hypothetical protein
LCLLAGLGGGQDVRDDQGKVAPRMMREIVICLLMAMVIAAMGLLTLNAILPFEYAFGNMFRFLATQPQLLNNP